MIYDAIKHFAEQFAWEPKIENPAALEKRNVHIVAGMGGSNLATGLVRTWNPNLRIAIHRDYGLPPLPESVLNESLLIASSYSGNTEEPIDAFEKAGDRKLPRAAIAVGGKLLDLAKKEEAPYIRIPDTGIQPRSALGFSFKALLKMMGEENALKETSGLAHTLVPADYESKGRLLAERLKGFVPIIYSSGRNRAIAYNWKIKFNEGAKIPAFWNVFPELNHNEMTGFDATGPAKELSRAFCFIFLRDAGDHPRVLKRMEVTERLYRERGLPVELAELRGENVFHKIFSSLVLADWAAYHLALLSGADPEEVPMVEEFKKLIL